MSFYSQASHLGSFLLSGLFATSIFAADWPQWMGPGRDGVYSESGIVDAIPSEGLPVVWRAEVGGGYAGPAVADGRVFVCDFVADEGKLTNGPGTRDKMVGTERTVCFDASSGKELWRYEQPRQYSLSFAAGPRATPTVDADRVYVLGAEGHLACLSVATGKPVWKRDIAVEFPSPETPIWGHSAHPLVDGDLLYCLGGTKNVAVALNKMTGETVWENLSASEIGYCPPTLLKIGEQRQLIIWHADAVNGLNPTTGDVLWSEELKPGYAMSIAAPVLSGDLLFTTGIGKTAKMLRLGPNGKPAETLWSGGTGRGIYSGNSTVIFSDNAIFGSDCESGYYMAIDPGTGERLWETFELTSQTERRASHGTAFTVKHLDKYFIFTETGDLVTAKLSRDGFEVTGRMKAVEPTNSWAGRSVVWTHPAFANKCVYIRNDKEIVCLNLAAK